MKNLTMRVSNYTHIYFPYNTVTSSCQGSGLACTCTVTIFRTLKYTQKRFRHQNNVNDFDQFEQRRDQLYITRSVITWTQTTAL